LSRSIVKAGAWFTDASTVRELAVKPAVKAAHRPGARERRRRADALRRHRADDRFHSMAAVGELAYVREQLRVAGRLTSLLADCSDIEEMAQLIVDELHETFAFYLASIQRLDTDGVLRLVAGRGQLAEVMTEFLLTEQPVSRGVNGRVARTGVPALVSDTRTDRDYIVRDPKTDPRSELAVAVLVDGTVWGVLNIEASEPNGLGEADAVLVESVAASLGVAIHRAPAVRACHERWDGGGYPDGLAGQEIPLAARIIAVCDTFDAMVTDRPYRPARPSGEARKELRRVAGAQLDPSVVDAAMQELSRG
jgi:putative methionine-R-sulfoxide reductase with GAF domain